MRTDESCANYGNKECETATSYRGTKSFTKTGITCQRWDTDFPHETTEYHDITDESYDLKENYCRNPDKWRKGPWCNTMDENVKWQECFEDCKSTV